MADESTPVGALAFVVECVEQGECPCGGRVLTQDDGADGFVVSHVHPTCERFERAMQTVDVGVERLPDAYVAVPLPRGEA